MKLSERMTGVIQMDPKLLKNHTLNIELYGEDLPENLRASIEQDGIHEPLLISRSSLIELDNVVVSGRRRLMAARMAKLGTVPCQEWKCEDEDDLKRELIIRNVRAELTLEQRTRMSLELIRIEGAKAQTRRNAGVAAEPGATGRTIDKVAAEVNIAPTTLQRSIKAVQAIDELNGQGRTEEAGDIRDSLNNGHATQAKRKAEEAAPTKPKENPETKELSLAMAAMVKSEEAFRNAVVRVIAAVDEKHKASQAFGSRFKKFESMLREISEHSAYPKTAVEKIEVEWNRTKEQLGND